MWLKAPLISKFSIDTIQPSQACYAAQTLKVIKEIANVTVLGHRPYKISQHRYMQLRQGPQSGASQHYIYRHVLFSTFFCSLAQYLCNTAFVQALVQRHLFKPSYYIKLTQNGGDFICLELPLYLAWEGLDNIPPQFRVAENTRRTPLAARHRRVESLLLNREPVFKQLEGLLWLRSNADFDD